MKIQITKDEAADAALLKSVGDMAKGLDVDLEVLSPAIAENAELHISREDAQDPQKYRRAKAIAAEKGQTLIIDPRVEQQQKKIEPGTVLIPRDADPATYRRMKADAVSRGVPYQVAD